MKIFKNKLFYLVSVVIYFVMLVFAGFVTYFFISNDAYSFLMKHFVANQKGSADVVEIIYDDSTTKEYGSMSRELFADILDYLKKYTKPSVIAFDTRVESYNPSNPADVRLLETVSEMDNLVSGYFRQELFSSYVMPQNLMKIFEEKNALNVKMEIDDSKALYSLGVTIPSQYIEKGKNFGSVYVLESGQMLLKSPVLLKINDAYYPSLPFKMYLLENNTNDVIVNSKFIIVPKTGLKIPYINDLKKDGTLKINTRFRQPIMNNYTYAAIPARAVLDYYSAVKAGINPEKQPELFKDKYKTDFWPPSFFDGKAVIIGSNVTGSHADVFKTPMAIRHSGVDFQATVYKNFDTNYFIDFWNSNLNFFFQIFLMVLLPVFTFVLLLRTKFLKGLATILGFDIAYLLLIIIFAQFGFVISWEFPLVFQFVTLVFGYSFKFITENRNKEKIKNAMGKYLSQDIMRNVVSNIDDLKLGGKRAIVTVLFSDIRGFTSMSEKMSAEDVSVILNEYFSEMEPIIRKYNGVINKFIGDAVMAIFGEPIQDINHAQNAVKCAYEMLKKVEYLREKWIFEGKPKIEIGVGINTGEVFVGNIGTENRMEYTVIGDTVNLASRIEHYNKVYKTNLLVSASTYAHIADIADVIKISEVQIRGKAKKMNIYEVLRIDKNN